MTNKNTTPNKILFSVFALAAFLLATGTVAALVTQSAAAQNTLIPTTSHQTQTCDTTSSISSISISCNGISNNNVANSPNQNSPSSKSICPTDFTLSQGQCIASVTFLCPSGTPFIFSLVGARCTSGPVGTFSPIIAQSLQSTCVGLGGLASTTSNGGAFIVQCFNARLTPTCPGGITPTNGECITKPS